MVKSNHSKNRKGGEKMDELKAFLIGFEQRTNEKFDSMTSNFKIELNQLKTEFDKKLQELRDEILDRQFVFEEEYGTKIDAILDAVTLELDKNLEKSEKIRTLDRRMDRAEAHIFNHEKKFARLEPKK